MIDDIVTRLRRIVPIHEGRKNHECIGEAADEIERLQAQAYQLAAIGIALYHDATCLKLTGCEQCGTGIKAWQARR
jgi:hypothetical protein